MHGGYVNSAVWGVRNASHAGTKSEVVHNCARWLPNQCLLVGAQGFTVGREIRNSPQMCLVATKPELFGGFPTIRIRGTNQKWLRTALCYYVILLVCGSPTFHSGGRNQKWPTAVSGGYVTPAVWGSPTLWGWGRNQKWRTNVPGGYVKPCHLGVPNASHAGMKSEVGQKCAPWLHNPCLLAGEHSTEVPFPLEHVR